MSYGLEVDLVRLAHEKDMLTTPYVFNPDEAVAMTEAGADIVVAHMGVTDRRSDRRRDRVDPRRQRPRGDGDRARRRSGCAVTSSCSAMAARSPCPSRRRLRPARCPDCHGFYGASSMERLPTEIALTEQTRAFKRMRRG